MWWPSFVAVLQDLWRFILGRSSVSVAETPLRIDLPGRQPVMEHVIARPPQPVMLAVGVMYKDTHPTTQTIRSYLGTYDTHLIRSGALTTQEWLLYVLLHQKLSVPALALYMTPVGSWHNTLKGQSGVSVGIIPRTQGLIEWATSATQGYAGLVTAVTPAELITIGSIDHAGMYTQVTHERSQWLELRPVFTTV